MSAYSDQVIADGASLYYRHGESTGTTMVDAVAAVNGAYNASGVTYAQASALSIDADTSVLFAGTANGATRADTSAANLGNGPFSIECWFKRVSTGSLQTLFTKGTNAYDVTFNASDQIEFRQNPSAVMAHTNAVTDTTSWHHLVVTKNGATRKIYLDGADATILDSDRTLSDTTTVLRLAHFSAVAGSQQRYNGYLDESALYKVELTAAQVLNHYELGQGMFRIPPAIISVTALGPATDLSLGMPATSVSGASSTATSLSPAPPAGAVSAAAQPPSTLTEPAIPAAQVNAAGGASNIQVDISIPIPAVGITGAAPTPETALDAGVPPASVGAASEVATADAVAIPAGVVDTDAVPPLGLSGVVQQIPPAVVSTEGAVPSITLDAEIPAGGVTATGPPPAGDVGTSADVPAAEISAVAPPPGIQIDVSAGIPAGVVNAHGTPPTITGADPGVGDDGGDGGGAFPVRRGRKKTQPTIDATVIIPAGAVIAGAPPPNYYLNEPDEDLAILLLYG